MAERIKNMAEEAGQSLDTATTIPQTENIGVKSPVPGVSPELFRTLSQRHPLTVIQEQRGKYPTHEAFLEAAEKEAEHIRLTEAQVRTNAALPDEERLQAAEKLLGPLSDEQEDALKKMHRVGEEELGKDEQMPAGVYNYTQRQIAEKARLGAEKTKTGEEVFSREERRKLFEAGLVGGISDTEYTNLNPLIDPNAITDPNLKQVASAVVLIGTAGHLNDQSLGTYAQKVLDLLTDGADQTEALSLINAIEGLRNYSLLPLDQREITASGPSSRFENILNAVSQLEGQPSSPSRDAALEDAKRERDNLLEEANSLGLLNFLKAELSGLYYSSRVGVTNNEREGRGVFQGSGKIQQLEARQRSDRSWERRGRFWSSEEVMRIQQNNPAYAQPGSLEATFRGVADDFYQKSMDIIVGVVKDRKAYTSQPYQEPIINNLWDGLVIDSAGHALKDAEGLEIRANNFDEVRFAIEEARRQEPWVPNPNRDWETYIRFVADDPEELEEMIPYIVQRVIDKLGAGQPNTLSQTLESEKGKLEGALIYVPRESERQFRRMKSIMADAFNLMGAFYFSEPEKINGDWGPYLSYMDLLAAASQDTEKRDHLIDALFLDRDGLTLLAVNQFLQQDGIFWRYGQSAANLGKEVPDRDMAPLFRWQNKRKKDITKFLMEHKLKYMQDLLNIDNLGISIGDPNHPAFQRLKAEYDRLDQEDKTAHNAILDADRQPTLITRWQEYCQQALEWQKTGKSGDPRAAERVIFQHPLARSFKRPTKIGQGQIYYEFLDMFEEDKKVTGKKPEDEAYRTQKGRKIKSLVGDDQSEGKAGRIARAFMLDSSAALAWHTVRAIDPKAQGSKLIEEQQRVTKELDEINKYLTAAGIDPITADQAVPQKTLFRSLMHALIAEDQTKNPKDKNFKFYYLLNEKLGLGLDMPTFAAWYLGSHDSLRPTVILGAIEKDNQAGGLKEAMPAPGMDEKNTGAAWAERERRLRLLTIMVMKGKFGGSGRFFNFPGYDTKGAGVKDVRNYLNLQYGTSTNTVWLNDLRDAALPLEQDFPGDYGATEDPITQLVGIYKGGNEIIFRQSGYTGLIENPRDFRSWVNRTTTNQERSKILTTGNKEGYAMMKDGPFTSMYLWRDYNWANLEHKVSGLDGEDYLIKSSMENIIPKMLEEAYRSGVDLAAKTIAPLVEVMKQTAESTFGPNPGAAKFANTLLWYAVSKWMDTSWEYRSKPGYAVDGNTHTARYFMHQYLLEYGNNGLIYDDKEWDEIMLGYVLKSDGTHAVRYNTAEDNTGEVYKGLIDAYPEELRKQILEGEDKPIDDSSGKIVYTIKDYWLPFGLSSKYPETFANYYRENDRIKKKYEKALTQVKKRKTVIRS